VPTDKPPERVAARDPGIGPTFWGSPPDSSRARPCRRGIAGPYSGTPSPMPPGSKSCSIPMR